MVVVMEERASEAQIELVVARLVEFGMDVHRSTGVTRTVLGVVGQNRPDAGLIEMLDGVHEVLRISRQMQAGQPDVQTGKHRPSCHRRRIRIGRRRSDHDGAGPLLGREREAGADHRRGCPPRGREDLPRGRVQAPQLAVQLPGARRGGAHHAARRWRRPRAWRSCQEVALDINQIEVKLGRCCTTSSRSAARNMPGTTRCFASSGTPSGSPVLLKRGLMATIEELLLSAEYILSGGNTDVILCERGIRTFETASAEHVRHLGDSGGQEVEPPADRRGSEYAQRGPSRAWWHRWRVRRWRAGARRADHQKVCTPTGSAR